METRVPADDGGWRAPTGPSGTGRRDPDAADSDSAVERRLGAIEDRLDAIEASISQVVTDGLQGASDEMRRAVSDLGRLLLRDLDRLTKVLAEHRDTIVERLQPDPVSSDVGDEQAVAPGASAVADAEPHRLGGEEGRWQAFPPRRRRRRRSPSRGRGDDTRAG